MKYLTILVCLLTSLSAYSQPKIGINVNKLSPYSSNELLLDKFKTGSGWIPQKQGTWDTGERTRIPVDANGWVTRLDGIGNDGMPVTFTSVMVLLNRELTTPYYKSGTYVILYDGEGNINCSFDCVVTQRQPGRILANVPTPGMNGIGVSITSTNPANYVRNIRVVHIDDEQALNQGQIFNRLWLQKMEKFQVLRPMDLLGINCLWSAPCNPIVNFNQRPKITDAFWGTNKGIPLEALMVLVNDTKADLWFNVPVGVSEDYVQGAGKLIKDLMKFKRTVYFEVSNEMWNTQFLQTQYAVQQADLMWPGNTMPHYLKQMVWYGVRTAQLCPVFKANTTGLVVKCIMSGQAVNTWHVQKAVDCYMWSQAPCDKSKGIDLIALAPYFGSGITSSLDALFQDMSQNSIPSAVNNIVNHINYANSKGMGTILYESGQHLISTDSTKNAVYIAANRDVRMKQMYTQYLSALNGLNIEAINLYHDAGQYNQYGSWGLLENINQVTSPKYEAVMDFLSL